MTDKKKFLLSGFYFVLAFFYFYLLSAFQLNPAIDTGREFYIPFRMLNGDVLYKDIFNIYGPFSYQINTFAYWLLGAKVSTLRVFGSLNTTLIMTTVLFILLEMFNYQNKKYIKFLISIPFIIGACSFGTFNYSVPYAYSMTYGLGFFLLSLLFFIKFSKNDIPKFAYISCLFAGAAFACKYEFTAYVLFLICYILVNKKIETKNVILSIIFLCLIPLLSFGNLFIQGVCLSDLTKTSEILKIMANSQPLKYLYSNFTGTYFNFNVFAFCIIKTFLLGVISIIYYFASNLYKSDKFLGILVSIFTILSVFYIGVGAYSLFAIINALLFFIFIKKIYQNKPVFIFMASSILLSLKTFFAVNIDVYGTYTLPFILISIGIFILNINFIDNDNRKEKILNVYKILVFALLFICCFKSIYICCQKVNGSIFVEEVKNSKNLIEIYNKSFYSYKHIAEPLNQAIFYIINGTKNTDRIVVLPETQFLNFVTKRTADNLYDSLTPMYFETFGEENIINHFKQTMPEYFVLNNRDTSDYGKRYICDDYGKQFCIFVDENYQKVATFGDKKYTLQILKRKDLL